MKRIIIVLAAIAVVSSCGMLKNSATISQGKSPLFITPVQADLDVSSKKIVYHLDVTARIRRGGERNVIATAVKEALDVEGADVLVGMEKQIDYGSFKKIKSITITGYPAKYINFRPCEGLPYMDNERVTPFIKKK